MRRTGATKYEQVLKAKLSSTRNVCVSKCSIGGFTIAQQALLANESGVRNETVFLKGAFHLEDLDGLIRLRDALTASIDLIEQDDIDWEDC